MKKKNIILLSLCGSFVITGIFSCHKKETPNTPFARIQGTWTKVKYATDDNNNGTIEASEIHPQPASIVDVITFTNEETGSETTTVNGVPSTPLTFNWKIVGGDSVWVAYKANDTVIYYLQAVSSHDLQLTTPTQFGLASYYYTK